MFKREIELPGHEGDQHVLADGDFAQVGGSAIGDHVALGQLVAALDDGALADVGVLVAALVLDEVVDVHAPAKITTNLYRNFLTKL